MKEQRHCAYCGKPSYEICKCKYRRARRRFDKGKGYTVEGWNISAEATAQEFLESIKKSLQWSIENNCTGTWKWSFSGVKKDKCG